MIYELRIYDAAPGKLEALHRRFRDHTFRIFEKHGMRLVTYGQNVQEGTDQVIYTLAFDSEAARDAAWAAFRADPEWQAARDASEREGKLTAKSVSISYRPMPGTPQP